MQPLSLQQHSRAKIETRKRFPAGSGVVNSSRENSPEQRSFREIVGGHKESELQKDEIMTKKPPKKPPHLDAKQPPVLQAIKKEKPSSEPQKPQERSEKDGAKSEHVTTKSEKTTSHTTGRKSDASDATNPFLNRPSSRTKASSSTSSDLGVVSDRAINDKITVEAFPPVVMRLREPLKSKNLTSSKKNTPNNRGQHPHRKGHFVIHKEAGEEDFVEDHQYSPAPIKDNNKKTAVNMKFTP